MGYTITIIVGGYGEIVIIDVTVLIVIVGSDNFLPATAFTIPSDVGYTALPGIDGVIASDGDMVSRGDMV